MEPQKPCPKLKQYVLYNHREYLLCTQSKASGSSLYMCLDFVQQLLNFLTLKVAQYLNSFLMSQVYEYYVLGKNKVYTLLIVFLSNCEKVVRKHRCSLMK